MSESDTNTKTCSAPGAGSVSREEQRARRLTQGALEREARTMRFMIEIYCRAHHASDVEPGKALCAQCEELLAYAMKRLACCPFGQAKPVCAKCRVHCYKPAMRERIAQVMRFSGPRVALRHPILSLEHLWKSLVVTPPEKPRAKAARQAAAAQDKDVSARAGESGPGRKER